VLALALCTGLLLMSGPGAASAQDPPLVLAFYYAWYDQNTWTSGLPADQPAQPYASSERAVVERHVNQAQAAGIDALIQSWYGPREQDNQTETNFRTLLDVAAARGFRAAVDVEVAGPFFPDRAAVTDALHYLLGTHAQHPAYLRYQGKPVVFFWRQGRFSPDEWAAIRAQVDPDHASLWIAEGVDIAYQAVFDGHHLYSIAWSPDVGRTLNDWGTRVRRYASQNGLERLWVATTMPGYDDTRTDRGDAFRVDRRAGEYYRQTWEAAASSQADWVVITSFNEWIEGTMIEPGQSYGELYLDLTRELAAAFKAGSQGQARRPEVAGTEQVTRTPPPPAPSPQPPAPSLRPPYIQAREAVRVRSGPGTDYTRLGTLTLGETAQVVGRNADRSWWQIEFAASDAGLGWVAAEFVTLIGDAASVPLVRQGTPAPTRPATRTPTPAPRPSPTQTRRPVATPTLAPPFVRANETVRVRSGPGTEYARLGSLAADETARVTGRSPDGEWWQIAYADAETGRGWVAAEFVTFVGNTASVPVVRLATATPTRLATVTPTRAPQPSATSTRRATVTPTSVPSPTPTRQAATVTPQPPPTPQPSPTGTFSPTPAARPTLRVATPTLQPTPTPQPTPTATFTPAPTLTPTPAGTPTAAPPPTHTPTLRTTPVAQRRPVGLLWLGGAALVLGSGMALVLLLRMRARR
jgi:uncharacterized protein YraI